MSADDTPEPALYERFTVTYSASGTVIQCFYPSGVTLEEARVAHPLAQVTPDEDSKVNAGDLPRREKVPIYE
jgi:hypothetical protein